jgi:hypothetical protein
MATFKQDVTLKFITNKRGEMEETAFKAGQDIQVVQVWDRFYLVKDKNGHFYNVHKELVQE